MIDRRWLIMVVLFLARTAMAFQFQSVGSTAPFLIADLHLDYTAIGSLIGLYILPGIVLAFPSGLLSRRFGDKRVCLVGLALMVVGGAMLGIGASPSWLFAGRAISGAGAVLFGMVLTKMTTDWFAGREIVLAMGVVLGSWPFGIAAALLLLPPLAAASGWRTAMLVTAALCGVAFLLIAAGYRDPPRAARPAPAADAPKVPTLPPMPELLPTLVAGVIWATLNIALIMLFSFAPAAMVERGVAAATATAWTGAALWIVMFSVPLGGLAVERIRRPDAAIVVCCLLCALTLGLLPFGVAPLVMAVAFGIAIGPPPGAIMALPARVLSPEHRAGGLGLFLTCYYLLVGVGPALAGLLRDRFGTAAAAVLFGAVLVALNMPLMWLFRVLERRLGSPASI